MKLFGTIFAVLILLVGAALALFLVSNFFEIVTAVYNGAKKLEPEVYVPLALTVTTATLGLTATLVTQAQSRKREIDAAHRERKLEIYLEFMEIMENLLMSGKEDTKTVQLTEAEIVQKLMFVRTRAVLWGSPRVLKALADITHMEHKKLNVFDVMERIQREMRKDLGLSNMGLEKNFFSKLILSNPDELETVLANKN